MHTLRIGARSSVRALATSLLLTTCLVGTASATVYNVVDDASYDLAVADANLTPLGPHTININAAGAYSQSAAAIFAGTINITVAGATLSSTAAGQYNSSLIINSVTGSTFATGAFIQTVGGFTGAGTLDADGAAGVLNFGGNNAASAFAGIVTSTTFDPAFNKLGTGAHTINGMTMAQGQFHVRAGSLVQGAGTSQVKYLALGSGVGNSATMTVSGGTLNIFGTTAATPCASAPVSDCPALLIGDLSGTGVLTQTGGTINVGGSVVATAHNSNFHIGHEGGTGTYNMSGGTLNLGLATAPNGTTSRWGMATATAAATSATTVGTLNLSGGLIDIQNGSPSFGFVLGDWEPAAVGGAASLATINQTGGTIRVRGGANFWLTGYANGLVGPATTNSVYNLNGGVLEVGDSNLIGDFAGSGLYLWNWGGGQVRVIGSSLATTSGVRATLTGLTAATGGTINTNGFDADINGVLSGVGWIVKTGTGTLTLDGVNTYTGGTGFNGGVVLVDAFDDLGAATASMSFNGGTLRLGAAAVLSGRNAVTGGTNMAGAGTIDTNGFSTDYGGPITGAGALTKIGAGTLDLTGANNAHSGALNVNVGTLEASGGSAVGNTSAVTVAAGAFLNLDIAGVGSETIGSLAGAGTVGLLNDTLITGGNNTSTTWTGAITGTGGLTKVGTGTMTVNASTAFTGLTTVSGGRYLLNGTAADGVTVTSGGTFGGNATVTTNLTVNAGGFVAPGNSPGTILVLGNYIGGGTLLSEVQFNNAGAPVNGTTHDFLSINGTASGVTGISVIPFTPSNNAVATTGNGIQLVRVGGVPAAGAGSFVLAAPVAVGGYEYFLNYLANYVGTDDGWFLQSQVRGDLMGHAAAVSASRVVTDACYRGHERDAGNGDPREARAWASVTTGNLSTDADTGQISDTDYTCMAGGIDFLVASNLRLGVSGGYGSLELDVAVPSGTGAMDGDQGVIEAYLQWSRKSLYANLSVGVSSTDWTYASPTTTSYATIGGMIGSGQVGARWGESVRFGIYGQLNYDGTGCNSSCFVTGTTQTIENVSEWSGKAAARIDGMFSAGMFHPYAEISLSDSLDGANDINVGTGSTGSDVGMLFGADIGVEAMIHEKISLFADIGLVQGVENEADGWDGHGGVKVHW